MTATTKTQNRTHSASGFDLRTPAEDEMWVLTKDLNEEERRVLLDSGTEAPFCGHLLEHKDAGAYVCRVCALPLFVSNSKFHSGSGWPSFFSPFDRHHVDCLRDTSQGMDRTEIRCGRCDSHLGHVFPDGPPPTGSRYCLNSISLEFVAADTALPDKLGRGDPRVV